MRHRTVRASAPGKVFLLGEYSVLDGAPALLAATDARVDVTVSPSPAGRWRLETLGLEVQLDAQREAHRDAQLDPRLEAQWPERALWELGPAGELPSTADARSRAALRVFSSVRDTLAAAKLLPDEPVDVTIDSTAFSRCGKKLGLGSSAAVTVALTAALTSCGTLARGAEEEADADADAVNRCLDRRQLFTHADASHRAAQGGTGSGGDTATSVYGGLILYTMGQTPTPLQWPTGLTAMAVVTGSGSSTTDLVARVNAYRERNPNGYRADILSLSELAGHSEVALGSALSMLELCDAYFEALVVLDSHANAGIVTKRHRELREIAADHGGVFKTSGAGGDDIGLAFCASGAATEKLSTAFHAAGADILPLRFDVEGVRVETEQ